jgi:hypothetical protein
VAFCRWQHRGPENWPIQPNSKSFIVVSLLHNTLLGAADWQFLSN